MYLFFDTETTGFPAGGPNVHLVQLAWILCDDQGNEKACADFTVKPSGYTIPEEVARIHGITQAIANTEGVPLDNVLSLFSSAVYLSYNLIGHNLDFDDKIVATEYARVGWDNPMREKTRFCTMKTQAVIDYCAILGNNGRYKKPKLMALHDKLFGHNFENAHNALYDVRATAKCFWKLRQLGLI